MDEGTILVVCTGNVCRSPLLERLLQRAMDERYGPGQVPVRSAGTGALVGHGMDERSAGVLAALGGSDEGFVARRLTKEMVSRAALILTATRDHRAEVVRLDPRAMKRAFTFGELASILRHLDPAELAADDGGSGDPTERLARLVALAASRRGLHRPGSWDEFDLADPYRREDAAYTELRAAVERDLPHVVGPLTSG